MPTSSELRTLLQSRLGNTIEDLNIALGGQLPDKLTEVLLRLSKDNQMPHWFSQLDKNGTLPNLDGKTIGSVLEMLLVAVLQTKTFSDVQAMPNLIINPAKGVDLPDLKLGIKSPSENYCTSEPFFSAYERLLGNEHDTLIILTDYQTAKKTPPLKLKIIKYKYLRGSEIADRKLCEIAVKHRSFMISKNEAWAKKFFRFLSFVNKSDWRGKQLLKIADHLQNEELIHSQVQQAKTDFNAKNVKLINQGKDPLAESELSSITGILDVKPILLGAIDAIDSWVVDTHKDFGRLPNNNEWERLKNIELDGKIGMSFALQWRYNFRNVFNI